MVELRALLRLALWLLLPLLTLVPSVKSATEIQGEISLDRSTAAFQCAALAAMSTEDTAQKPLFEPEVDRLFHYGVAQARISLPEDKGAVKLLAGDLGPWHAVENMSRDFWIGVLWAGVNADVEKLIGRQYPAGSIPLATDLLKTRALAAENEFHKRNCRLIGR